MTVLTCPACSARVEVPDGSRGARVFCTSCGGEIADGAESAIPTMKVDVSEPEPTLTPMPVADDRRPCPSCGTKVRPDARICFSCKAELVSPTAPAPALAVPPEVRQRSQAGMWIVIAVAGSLLFLCGIGFLGLLLFGQGLKQAGQLAECRTQLHVLASRLEEAVKREGRPAGAALRGEAFLKAASGDAEFSCPGHAGKGTGYRGPARPWSALAPSDVVCCCDSGNHGDALLVLTRDFKVREIARSSPEFAQVLAGTSK